MAQIKKTIYFLFFAACCFLLFTPIQGMALQVETTLTWSTNTYTPPGYLGKALPAKGSIVEVVANISSQKLNPQELFYEWFLDDNFQENGSGKGRQVFKFDIGERTSQKRTVKVIIKNREGGMIEQSSYLTLSAQEPEIILETKALLLSYSKSIPEYQVTSNKKTVFTARLFFFDIKKADDLIYQWILGDKKAVQINEQSINNFTLGTDQIITPFRQDLTVRVENKNNLLQRTSLTAGINFIP